MKSFLTFLFISFVVLLLGLGTLWFQRDGLLEKGAEKWIETTQFELFEGPVNVQGLHVSNGLMLSIEKVSGTWKTPEGGFPFELQGIRMRESLLHLVRFQPLHIDFDSFRPGSSLHPGVAGELAVFLDKKETIELKGQFRGLYIEELAALNPETLSMSSGKMVGDLYLKADKAGTQALELNVQVAPPGGKLPAQFFGILSPYLPPAEKKILSQIQLLETVGYQEAEVSAAFSGTDSIKMLLKIKVPDYNLNLNLNLTVRVEDNREIFFQLGQIMGLVKVGAE